MPNAGRGSARAANLTEVTIDEEASYTEPSSHDGGKSEQVPEVAPKISVSPTLIKKEAKKKVRSRVYDPIFVKKTPK